MPKRGNGEGTIGRTKDGRWCARYYVETSQGRKRKAIYAHTRLEAATKLAHAIAQRQLKLDRRNAGFSHFRFHDLRHTAATLMLRAGTPVNVVANVLGRSDPAMTLRRYAHALPDM